MFVNLSWRAEGFGLMWMSFEFGSLNNLCLVFTLKNQKKSMSGETQKLTFWLGANFLLKIY